MVKLIPIMWKCNCKGIVGRNDNYCGKCGRKISDGEKQYMNNCWKKLN